MYVSLNFKARWRLLGCFGAVDCSGTERVSELLLRTLQFTATFTGYWYNALQTEFASPAVRE